MRFDLLLDRLSASIGGERTTLRRVARYVLPLLLLPLGPAVAQIPTGWLGLLAGGLVAMAMLVQAEMFIRPSFRRARVVDHDLTSYLGLAPPDSAPAPERAVPLMLPGALALLAGATLFMPAMLASAGAWQRLAALALAGLALWAVWSRLAATVTLLDSVTARLQQARDELGSPRGLGDPRDDQGPTASAGDSRRAHTAHAGRRASSVPSVRAVAKLPPDGLLEPEIARRAAGLPLPALRLSPAATALLRTHAYLTLHAAPATDDRALIDQLAALGREAYAHELRHSLLPPVGGKIYLPVAASGTLASMLGATARRLGMDGAYSGSLRTWLVRLPPARSYAVAARLVDSVAALGILPNGVLPHHLTIQGDLGPDARILSIVHLAAAPLLLEERPGRSGDERPFIMRGGGVLDDLSGRGRTTGPRTDFIDGFLFVNMPEMEAATSLAGHAHNLRLKQVLAYGLVIASRPAYQRAPHEEPVAAAFGRLRQGLRALLARYQLQQALDADWLDGPWSAIWPLIEGMGRAKQRDPQFLEDAQRLRDDALREIESLASAAAYGAR